MTTRRGFLTGAASAGMMFCTCALQDVAAQASHKHPRLGSKRAPVMFNGERVKTIDTHAHCYFHDAVALMGADAKGVMPPVKGVPEHFIPVSDKAAVEGRLAAMDAMGLDLQILSVNPFWYRKDRDTAAAIVKLNNERLAELTAAYPKRLGGFASLTLQFPDLAVQQLEDAMKKAGPARRGNWQQPAG